MKIKHKTQCQPSKFLDLAEKATIFQDSKGLCWAFTKEYYCRISLNHYKQIWHLKN